MTEKDQVSDATRADPVHDYYAEKKQRYLKHLRGKKDVPEMKTATLHDWDDAAGYAQPHDANSPKD